VRQTKPISACRDSELASLRGRIGGFVLHARHDPRATTAPARRAFLARFETEVDPTGSLSPAERLRRAEAARKAYFARLAYRSALARATKRRTIATSDPANGATDGR
jgi:hypothetical protein